jgi:thiol-disulfide isomerase/thioredoxin
LAIFTSLAAGFLFATHASAAPPNGDAAKQVRLTPATAPEILRAVRASDGNAVLVNVWATWCLPCRKEFPDLVRLGKDYADRGLKVVFVSGDFDGQQTQVIEFLAAHGVMGETYLKAGKDGEFIDAFDRNWSGALPATFLYDGTGALRHSVLEAASYEQLEKLIVALLNEGESKRADRKGESK